MFRPRRELRRTAPLHSSSSGDRLIGRLRGRRPRPPSHRRAAGESATPAWENARRCCEGASHGGGASRPVLGVPQPCVVPYRWSTYAVTFTKRNGFLHRQSPEMAILTGSV